MGSRVAKTKTFTGCWTCRRRKVKCQGPRPECERCRKAGLLCEGFEVKLCWSHPTHDFPDSPGVAPKRERINIPRGRSTLSSYNVEEADRILRDLDKLSLQPNCDAAVGPFSVFQAKGISLSTQPGALDKCVSPSTRSACSIQSVLPPTATKLASETEVATYTAALAFPQVLEHGHSEALDLNEDDLQPASPKLPFSEVPVSHGFWLQNLLSYYASRLADILQPVNHPQNPFRTIHVRYAMAFVSNPASLHGQTRYILGSNKAICHSLISTAAFHLRGSNAAKRPGWSEFDRIGRFHHLKAMEQLRDSLSDVPVNAEDHYVRVAAILTLVTSTVMEGSMSEVLVHLQGCERLRRLYITKGSTNHQAPHMRQLDSISQFLSAMADTTRHHLPNHLAMPTLLEQASLFDSPFEESDASLEFTYGITASISSFIYLTTKFSQYARFLDPADTAFGIQLADAVKTLADLINSWTLFMEPFTSIPAEDTDTLSLVQNLALSFHYAAQIYFRSCFALEVPGTGQSTIEQLSAYTIVVLEEAEAIKARLSRAAPSICWPAFVAACVAPVELRERWVTYWQMLGIYGIGNVPILWKVVQEVWRRDDEEAVMNMVRESHMVEVIQSPTVRVCTPKWTDVLRENDIAILAV